MATLRGLLQAGRIRLTQVVLLLLRQYSVKMWLPIPLTVMSILM